MVTDNEITNKINSQEWGFNNAPTSEQLIESLCKFSIASLIVGYNTIVIKFRTNLLGSVLFTFEQMIEFTNIFSSANEMDIIDDFKIRLWWD